MGAPGYAVFCSRGHLCKSVGHHEIDDREPECLCGSKKFWTQAEWGDDDYDQFVPSTSIGEDEYGPIWDISGLMSKKPVEDSDD